MAGFFVLNFGKTFHAANEQPAAMFPYPLCGQIECDVKLKLVGGTLFLDGGARVEIFVKCAAAFGKMDLYNALGIGAAQQSAYFWIQKGREELL